MRKSHVPFVVVAVGLLAGCPRPASVGVGRTPTPPIRNAKFLLQYAATVGFRLGHPRKAHLTPDGRLVLFLRSRQRAFTQDLYAFDTHTGKERVLLTAAQILHGAREKLSVEEKARRERMREIARGIASYRLSRDGRRLLVPLGKRLFLIELASRAIIELKLPPGPFPLDPRLSPDARRVAYVRGGDLYVFDVAAQRQLRLTTRPNPNISNGTAEFVAQEEMGRMRGYWFSPDGRWLAYQQTDTTGVEEMHLVNPARPYGRIKSWPYPRPGKRNAAVRLGLIPVAGGTTRWVGWDRRRYPYLVGVKWRRARAPLTVVVQNRRQNEMAVLAVDTATGATRGLHVERDAAWLNIDQKVPRWLPDGSGFLWSTERRGAWQLELRGRDGKLIRALTSPDLGLRGLVDVDPATDSLWVAASPDPTESHLYRLSLSGKTPPRRLTRERGLHGAQFAARHGFYVERTLPWRGRPRWVVRRRDGKALGTLRSVAAQPPFLPRVELTTVGPRRFHAAIVRPRDFQPGRRYPVIVYVYGGPHYGVVKAASAMYLIQQWMADQGFIVVALDGRGTPWRGRAWERSIRGDLISIPLADQVAGLRALGKRFPELDLGRVGVFGWSFGGYFSAHAVMQRPDVYHAAVVGAPVADWRDYDTHYTERYLGLPQDNPRGYRHGNVLRWAPKLRRPVLLVHGTVDDNVYFLHSVKIADALFRAGRDFRFLPLSGFTHIFARPQVQRRLYERIIRFFQRNLVAPR